MSRAKRLWSVLAVTALLGACVDPETGPDGGRRDTGRSDGTSGTTDSGTTDRDTGTGSTDDSGSTETPSDSGNTDPLLDGGGIYDDGGTGGDGGCPFGDSGVCTPVANGCVAGTEPLASNGLDDNCDGTVDENIACIPGMVQRCFLGPPGRIDPNSGNPRGTCAFGMQTCQGAGEFGTWGPCAGGISPQAERCDNADNDCDGCIDDGLCCNADGTCPTGTEPWLQGTPFQRLTINGSNIYSGPAMRWDWTVEGGPCDQMLFAAGRQVTYYLNPASTPVWTTAGSSTTAVGQNLNFFPSLSGDYRTTLRVTRPDGSIFECTFIIKVRAPGFRAELCWDKTGSSGSDIDFWVHRPNTMTDWTGSNMCYYANCRNSANLNWGYGATSGTSCREPVSNQCRNPRLDLDNIQSGAIPENINVDNPNANENFRVAVNYFGINGLASTLAIQPMVNIYCGGALQATFGGARINNVLYGSQPITGFNTPGSNGSGSLWRVADVLMTNATACTITPLRVRNTAATACVETNSNRTYNGATCERRP